MGSTLQVSDLTLHRIVELDSSFMPALEMLPGLTPELLDENRAWLRPDALDPDDVFRLCYQSYVVRTPHHVVLVDSCLGNDKARSRAEWHMKSDDTYLRALAAVGLGVEDVDYVLCTHLHSDHVGWNTRLVDGRWVPTFPNARYVFGREEHALAEKLNRQGRSEVYADSVLPILEAGRADLVDGDHRLGDHVRLLPTPGHTPGHVAIVFGNGQDDLVMTGDLVHVPIQMRYPELSFVRDMDPSRAGRTRRSFLDRYCDTPTICCTAHFPSPSAGRIRRWGSGFRLQYEGADG